MGGQNPGSVGVPPASVRAAVDPAADAVRFHENDQDGEVHFHNDGLNLKCAIKSAVFFDLYTMWRERTSDPLVLFGHDGSGGLSSVHIHTFPRNGKLDVTISIKKAEMGQGLLALDKLAGYTGSYGQRPHTTLTN